MNDVRLSTDAVKCKIWCFPRLTGKPSEPINRIIRELTADIAR